MDVLVAAAGSLWLSIDPLFRCSEGGLATPILVGWLVGWLVLPTVSLGGRRAGAGMGSSCAVVLSTILVAVSQNCVVGQPASQWLAFFWLAKSVGVKKSPRPWALPSRPNKDLGNFYFYFYFFEYICTHEGLE
jgi:hypothetical protein